MKTALLLSLIIAQVIHAQPPPISVLAGDITFEWNASTTMQPPLIAYRLMIDGNTVADTPFLTATAPNVVTGAHVASVVAYYVDAPSNASVPGTLDFIALPPIEPPASLRIASTVTLDVQTSSDLAHWSTFASLAHSTSASSAFYRLLITSTPTTPTP